MVKDVRIKGHPIEGITGEVTEIVGTTRDSSDGERVEDAFGNSQSQLREMIERIPAFMWRGSPDGALDYVDARYAAYLGRSIYDIRGGQWLGAVHPEDRDGAAQKWSHCARTGCSYSDIYRILRADGQYRWVESVGERVHDKEHQNAQWYGVVVDVDDRKRAEDASRETEVALRLMVDSIPALVCTMTARGDVDLANRQTLEYLGQGPNESKDWTSNRTVHEDDLENVVTQWRHSVTTGKPYDVEHRIRRADGVYRWFHVRGLPLRNPDGRIVRWYVLCTDIDDRRRSEQAVRASEAHLRLITETIPALLWRATGDGQIEYVNNRVLEYTGLSLDSLRRSGWTPLIHPEDVDDALRSWLSPGRRAQSDGPTFRLRRADGVYRWFHLRADTLWDEEGGLLSSYGVLLDVDDHKKVEESVRERERYLHDIVETLPAVVWRATASGAVDYANKRLEDYVGEALHQVAGVEWIHTLHPDDVDPTVKKWGHACATGMSYDTTFRVRRANGEYGWVRVVGEPLRSPEGSILNWYGLMLDIDDQKKAEHALLESEEHLRTIVETIPAIVSRSTPDGRIEFVNHRGLDYLGRPADLIGSKGFQFLHPDDRKTGSESWLACLRNGEPHERTLRLRRADGAYRWFYVRVEPFRDQEGRVVSWYSVSIDVDDRKQMEETLRNTQRSLSAAMQVATVAELSASIAHEINQPLAAVVANGHACHTWLSSDPPNLKRARLTVERIIRDGNSASDVVRRIRALFGKAAPKKVLLNINDVVSEVLEFMGDELRSQRVTVHTDLTPALPEVLADGIQIQQTVINLVHNAIEAMRDGSDSARVLWLSSRRDGGDVVIDVRDYGCGIPNVSSIFEPFFTTKASGMGMGLSICRSIVEDHGGRLWATPNEGAGTTFSFTVPVHPQESDERAS
jgi:PAS domain S-box-containing protein